MRAAIKLINGDSDCILQVVWKFWEAFATLHGINSPVLIEIILVTALLIKLQNVDLDIYIISIYVHPDKTPQDAWTGKRCFPQHYMMSILRSSNEDSSCSEIYAATRTLGLFPSSSFMEKVEHLNQLCSENKTVR